MERDVVVRRERLSQGLGERRVYLDHVHMPGPGRQAFGENAQSAPDLDHHIVRRELGQALNHIEDVAVDEEVLTELADAPSAHHPNTLAALRSTAPSSSAYDAPRSAATARAVCTTLAGSFGLPRTA